MPKAKTKFQKVTKQPTARRPDKGMPRAQSLRISDVTRYLWEHEDEGSTQELLDRFREECPHSFQEIASMRTEDSVKRVISGCKVCGLVVVGKPKKVVSGKKDSTEEK